MKSTVAILSVAVITGMGTIGLLLGGNAIAQKIDTKNQYIAGIERGIDSILTGKYDDNWNYDVEQKYGENWEEELNNKYGDNLSESNEYEVENITPENLADDNSNNDKYNTYYYTGDEEDDDKNNDKSNKKYEKNKKNEQVDSDDNKDNEEYEDKDKEKDDDKYKEELDEQDNIYEENNNVYLNGKEETNEIHQSNGEDVLNGEITDKIDGNLNDDKFENDIEDVNGIDKNYDYDKDLQENSMDIGYYLVKNQ